MLTKKNGLALPNIGNIHEKLVTRDASQLKIYKLVSIKFASKIIPMELLTLGERKFVDLIYTRQHFLLSMARLNMWLCHIVSPVPQVLVKDLFHLSLI
jgi:hypothetical protein